MKSDQFSLDNLTKLYKRTAQRRIGKGDKFVIFSDIHLGNGKRIDDFKKNSKLFLTVLSEYYLKQGYSLILNGDIEELQRFRLSDIRRAWPPFYNILDSFDEKGRFYRIIGNHDLELLSMRNHGMGKIHEALHFSYKGNNLFLFHGHQTSKAYQNYNRFFGFLLRYLANPLHINNVEVSHSSQKRFRTERRVYDFATKNKLLSIVGHTHRPLFESMSKIDSIKFEIERLCRKYSRSSVKKQSKISEKIRHLKTDLTEIVYNDHKDGTRSSLYDANLVVPCMFNSGCTIGKRGITGIEISDGMISLVHWFDRKRSRKHLKQGSKKAWQLNDSDFFRLVIKKDNLDYIFARIKLLA